MTEKEWRQWIRDKVRGSTPFLWVLDGELACSPRPLRYHPHPQFGGRVPLIPAEAAGALSDWIQSILREGIGTITCLATPGELKRYTAVVGPNADLMSFYRSRRIVVHHHPVEDPAHAPLEARSGILEQLEQLKPVVLDEYRQRVGALLVHCSGGMDRAAPIAAFVAAKETTRRGNEREVSG